MKIDDCSRILKELKFNEDNNIQLVNGNQLSEKHALLHSPDEFALYYFSEKSISSEKLSNLVNAAFKNSYRLTQIFINSDDSFDLSSDVCSEISYERLTRNGGYLFLNLRVR